MEAFVCILFCKEEKAYVSYEWGLFPNSDVGYDEYYYTCYVNDGIY
jgi:hypothetical protein